MFQVHYTVITNSDNSKIIFGTIVYNLAYMCIYHIYLECSDISLLDNRYLSTQRTSTIFGSVRIIC